MNKNANSADVRYLTRIAGKSLTMPAEDNSQGQYAGSISRLYDRPRLEEVNVTQWGPIPFEFDHV